MANFRPGIIRCLQAKLGHLYKFVFVKVGPVSLGQQNLIPPEIDLLPSLCTGVLEKQPGAGGKVRI